MEFDRVVLFMHEENAIRMAQRKSFIFVYEEPSKLINE